MARKNSKTTKSQSVKEFKAWLSGILEFQPEDWVPDLSQWKSIQDRIANLQEDVITSHEESTKPITQIPSQQLSAGPNNQPQQMMHYYPQASAPLFDQATGAEVVTLLPTGEGEPEQLHIPPAPNLTPNPQTLSSRVLATGKTIKTPSVDTSQKPYKSNFA